MPAYIIVRVQVTDEDKYSQYKERTPEAVAKHGGRFIVRGGQVMTLEGPEETRRIVVIEFPTLQRAQDFYKSDEYQNAKMFRHGAADAQFIAVDGC